METLVIIIEHFLNNVKDGKQEVDGNSLVPGCVVMRKYIAIHKLFDLSHSYMEEKKDSFFRIISHRGLVFLTTSDYRLLDFCDLGEQSFVKLLRDKLKNVLGG